MDRPDSMSQVSTPSESRHDNAATRDSAISADAASNAELTPEYDYYANDRSNLQEPNSIPMGDVHFNHNPPELGDDEQPPKFQEINPNSAKLGSSATPLFLVLVYIAFALPSWVIICYLSLRPITADHYGYWVENSRYANYERYARNSDDVTRHASLYARNEQWYHAALVIQSILSVLAIPVVSAVCSYAAVVFIQRKLNRGGQSMRQVMTLADNGWISIPTYFKAFTETNGWKRYSSSFLLFAGGLSILTVVISGPLQNMFLFSKSVKVPTISSIKEDIWQISDISPLPTSDDEDFSNTHWLSTRHALETASSDDQADLLWGGNNASCSEKYESQVPSIECNLKGTSLSDINQPNYPFFAPVTRTANTGLIRQFLSRINSTATYESISQDEFPKDCENTPGAYYVNYLNVDTVNETTWGLEACMPNDMTKSPWKAIRTRQDFTEELYIKMTWIQRIDYDYGGRPDQYSWFKLTINTTAGYFELPNYMNGGKPGDLLKGDPITKCKEGENCQFTNKTHSFKRSLPNLESNLKRDYDDSLQPANVINKGPLLTIAIALFGEGSFLQTRYAHPEFYGDQDAPLGGCLWLTPMARLIPSSRGRYHDIFKSCVYADDGGWNGTEVTDEIMNWLSIFSYDPDSLSKGFTAAAFLANKFWVQTIDEVLGMSTVGSMSVASDMGADTQVPVLSSVGIIVVSVLLGLDILLLLAVAVYATWIPRWTSTMDSFAMMRIGAAVADKVPLLIGRKTDGIGALDTISGCVGDQSREEDYTGRLGVGADRALDWKKGRRFECYSSDAQRQSTRTTPNWSRDV